MPSSRVRCASLLSAVSVLACGDPTATTGSATETTGSSSDTQAEPTGAGEGEAPLPFEPGSRLLPRTLASSEDPARVAVLLGWRDQELALDCEFADTVEGDVRCLPIHNVALRRFSSPDCAAGTEVAVIDDCGVGLAVHERNAPGADESCGEWSPQYRAIELGQKLPNTTVYYRNSWGSCVPDSPANVCEVTEVPLSGFVGAEFVPEAVGAIERHTLVGDDGSREIKRGYDPEIEHAVYPDRGRLVPDVHNALESFADPECTQPAACSTSCIGAVTVFERGCEADVARLGAAEVDAYELGGACTAQTPNPDLKCHEVVEIRPPLLHERQQVGEGRLQRVWARHADAPLMPLGWSFYDTVLGTRCGPEETSPGQYQCVYHGNMGSVFSDPECLVRIGAERRDSDCGQPPDVVAGPEGPLRVIPLPEVKGPTYSSNGVPDGLPVPPAFCSERPDPAPIYDLVPTEVGWAPMVRL